VIKTKQEVVKAEGSIWALPKYAPKLGEFPFRYELRDGTCHYDNRAILVTEVELCAVIPEGVDLYSRALETLTVQENEAMRVYSEAMMRIAEVRKSLLLLDAPKAAPVEGEYIPAPVVPKIDNDIPF